MDSGGHAEATCHNTRGFTANEDAATRALERSQNQISPFSFLNKSKTFIFRNQTIKHFTLAEDIGRWQLVSFRSHVFVGKRNGNNRKKIAYTSPNVKIKTKKRDKDTKKHKF
jgi:hypothetical protein